MTTSRRPWLSSPSAPENRAGMSLLRRLTHVSVHRLRESARSNLWLLPLLIVVGSTLASFATLSLDELHGERLRHIGALNFGPDGARATLSAIAGSVMTVAGVTFSITIVVLQLASTQYSPRVLRGFVRNRLIQLVLGAFIGTFTYSLLVLRRVSAGFEGQASFVPAFSVTVAVVFATASMVLLIAFIDHIVRSVQVPSLVRDIVEEARRSLDRLYPGSLGRDAGEPDGSDGILADAPCDTVAAPSDGYLELIEDTHFDELPRGLEIRLLLRPGEFAQRGVPVLEIRPRGALDDDARQRLAASFSLLTERTVRQDVGFALRMIVDIAVRALSPGVNDPTTAIYCVNGLTQVLKDLAERPLPSTIRMLDSNGLRIVAPRPSLDELVRLAFWQVIHYGRGDVQVLTAVVAALRVVADRAASPPAAIRELLEMIGEAARDASWPSHDRRQLADAAAMATASMTAEASTGTISP